MAPVGAAKRKATPALTGLVRNVYFMGVPQSGTPVMFLADFAL